MIRNTIILFISISYCISADVYEISADEYKKYLHNPTEMTKIFKNRFIKTALPIQKVEVVENNSTSQIAIEKSTYDVTLNKVLGKLRYTALKQEKSVETLISDVDFLLKFKNISYNTDEVLLVIKQINSGKLSPFEANIYLQQLIKLIKD